jgi:hypothetical protein
MTYKKCACCGKATLETGSMHDVCSFCGWEDDNVQNNNPDYWGGANLITLNEARQVVADGKDLRAYISRLNNVVGKSG